MADLVEIFDHTGEGYAPLVFSEGWLAARLNWEPIFDLKNAGEIERHNQTDEVFVLWRGKGVLFVSDGERMQIEEMQPGLLYNVPRGIWHNLIANRTASWIIVENPDTNEANSENRQLTPGEWEQLRAALPGWPKE